LVNQQKKSDAVLFLKKIKGTKEFPQQLNYYKSIYGQDIEKEVFAEEIKRKEEIKKLETILEKNQKARDVLLKLAILYFEDENFKKAQEYYQRAKEIDPMVKVEELEKL
jgi:tetratricopeptide (TPR) repeat protein